MYVILTSKPGVFRTEVGEALEPMEAYDYVYCGRTRASFVIAALERDVKVRIVEESDGGAVNLVPSKFLPRFQTLEEARAELRQLVSFGSLDASLVKR